MMREGYVTADDEEDFFTKEYLVSLRISPVIVARNARMIQREFERLNGTAENRG
jgi:hypothetical protein